jgi:hypothetical protein
MNLKSLTAAILANTIMVEGAVLTLYSGPNCSGSTSSRNVYDNTCATGVMGFQSYKITSGGTGGQVVTTFSQDACAGTWYSCESASNVGTCYNSFGTNYSGSNAVSSSPVCGSA